MERIFMREKLEEEAYRIAEKRKIGVVGMSRNAGATFVATSLAQILAADKKKRVSFLEIRDAGAEEKPLIYDALGMDRRFAGRDFVRFYEEVREGRNIKGRVNLDERVNWALAAPGEVCSLTAVERARLVNNFSGDVILCDIDLQRDREDFLADMDALVFVIDPMPSAMLAGYPLLGAVKKLAHKGKPVYYLLNKFNEGILKGELHDFLRIKPCETLPMLETSEFYAAEYNCRIPYQRKKIRERVGETLAKLAHRTITEL